MSDVLEEYLSELSQDIQRKYIDEGKFSEEAFFELGTQQLLEIGEISESHYTHYSRTGIRIDGYGGDPRTINDGTLSVVITDYDATNVGVATLNRGELEAQFGRLTRFVERARTDRFRNQLEESDPVFSLADTISNTWDRVNRIRMILITNKELRLRADRIEASPIDGIPVSRTVWDISRMNRYYLQGQEREDMILDLENDFGGPILALPAYLSDSTQYQSYIAVLGGDQLAQIYDRWSDRLLEQNVRVFLQARGGINRGIRNTLMNEPDMFFAYNNGITATAEGVKTREGTSGLEITEIRNFQIVNGGQTTGSIFTASKSKDIDLSDVFVQMKLSVISPEQSETIVPKISEYANSQNRINAADFFSNHPFHVRIQEFSRRIYAPPEEGSTRQTKWFYERVRGQYQNDRANAPNRNQFDMEYPKGQKLDKKELGIYLNLWSEMPHIVLLGGDKNFREFANITDREWNKNQNQFNELYYRSVIAKTIVFRATENIISHQPWWEVGSFRRAFTAYTISKLAYDVRVMNAQIDFEQIWRARKISNELHDSLTVGSTVVKDVILNPSQGGYRNPQEWHKSQNCWKRVADLEINWPDSLVRCLVTDEQSNEAESDARADQKVLNGIEAQMAVFAAGSEFWDNVRTWANRYDSLTESERQVMSVACSLPNMIPDERQSERLIVALKRLQNEGCPLSLGN